MHFFKKNSVKSVLEHYVEACDWINNCGIDYSKSRFSEYRKILASYDSALENNSINDFSNSVKLIDVVNAVFEANEIIKIYDGLKNTQGHDYSLRLSDVAKGSLLRYDEGDKTHARDISFELYIAAMFVASGYNVDFSDIADIKVSYRNITLFVECKRLNSERKVQNRISEGLKQLHKRYQTSKDPLMSKGLLALSIGRIANPKFHLLSANTSEELELKASSINNNFIKRFSKHLHKTKDRRTIGTIILLETPGLIINENDLLTTVSEVGINNSCPTGSIDEKWLHDIAFNVFVNK